MTATANSNDNIGDSYTYILQIKFMFRATRNFRAGALSLSMHTAGNENPYVL